MTERTAPAGPGGLIRGLGFWSMTALVVGNVVASGIFVMPAQLAETAGPVALVAWGLCAVAFLILIAVFADLGGAFPLTGGLQAFVERAFGRFAGLNVAYLYWISGVITNAAFLTGFIGYLAVFFPGVDAGLPAFVIAQVLLWSLTFVNVLGVRAGGRVQIVTVALKLAPLLVLTAYLLPHVTTENLVPFAPHGWGAVLPALSLVAWLFVGAESVTVPGEEVKGEGPVIRRAAYAGYLIAAALYLIMAFAITAGMPGAEISGTPSPLAVAALKHMGPAGQTMITVGALVSIFGALNGWLLVVGRLPFAAARDGYAPRVFARIHPRFKTPHVALIISSAITGLLVTCYFNRSLVSAYSFISLTATATALIAIGASCFALIVLVRREPGRFTPAQRRRSPAIAALGVIVVLFMIAGTGVGISSLAVVTLVVPVAYWLAGGGGRRNTMPPGASPSVGEAPAR
jgi:APA family basic amino acid/polyamine antiporter